MKFNEAAIAAILLLFLQGSLGRHLLQDEVEDEPICVWDEDEEKCVEDQTLFEALTDGLNDLIDQTQVCVDTVAADECSAEDGCFWTEEQCTASRNFTVSSGGNSTDLSECVGTELAELFNYPQKRSRCRSKYEDEESCEETDDCSWNDDSELCDYDVFKSLGLGGIVSVGAEVLSTIFSVDFDSVVEFGETLLDCASAGENKCKENEACSYDNETETCSVSFITIVQAVEKSFPLVSNATCLALKSLYRTECPSQLIQKDCEEEENCLWDKDEGVCFPKDSTLETEAEKEIEKEKEDIENLCKAADTKNKCEKITGSDVMAARN